MFSKGIDAWWLDAAEPDIAGTPTLDTMRTLMNPNGMGTGAKVLNAYPLLESKAVYEGQRQAAPDRRVFILTRSGYPGMQRYSAVVWSGDSTSTWPALRNQIMAGLGFSISGMPYWSMDIGGYQPPQRLVNPRAPEDKAEWDELQTRWFEFGTFVPVMRVHGQGAREIYNFGDQAISAMTRYDQLRYALMPYIYSLAGDATQNDGTIMRPLVMDFPADATAREVSDQYMFGPAILVNPVTTDKARTRSVYLPPAANWYEFWSGQSRQPGTTIEADAPFDSIPLFIKSGSIIPTAPVVQYTGEKPHDPITLYIYTGENGAFTLYEDEGNNFNYEHGAFAQIPMTWNDAAQTLTIGRRQGSFPGMLDERTFDVIFVSKDHPVGFAFDAKPEQSIKYSGDEISLKKGS
jgi:alpha-D-xyloside xylohydrolase